MRLERSCLSGGTISSPSGEGVAEWQCVVQVEDLGSPGSAPGDII